MPFPRVALLFENPVQYTPVLSQFSIYTLYDMRILHISGSSFFIFLYCLVPGVLYPYDTLVESPRQFSILILLFDRN